MNEHKEGHTHKSFKPSNFHLLWPPRFCYQRFGGTGQPGQYWTEQGQLFFGVITCKISTYYYWGS
jgi:hypothetical protein